MPARAFSGREEKKALCAGAVDCVVCSGWAAVSSVGKGALGDVPTQVPRREKRAAVLGSRGGGSAEHPVSQCGAPSWSPTRVHPAARWGARPFLAAASGRESRAGFAWALVGCFSLLEEKNKIK